MPIYEWICQKCGTTHEGYRSIEKRDLAMICPKGHKAERIYSVPALSIWDADRPFPNAVHFGEGKFPTKSAYESHLKANDMAEVAIDGRNKSRVPRSMRVRRGA